MPDNVVVLSMSEFYHGFPDDKSLENSVKLLLQ